MTGIKILVFLQGTVIMHREALGCTREERVKQVIEGEQSIHDYSSYVPVENAVKKLQAWKEQGAEIIYLSSHERLEDVEKDESALKKYGFPKGKILFRRGEEEYKDIVERVVPNILIEDDCESIGGEKETVYPHIISELRSKVKSIVVKEFGGIDHLADEISELIKRNPHTD